MPPTGNASTCLIILRGNSASGKTSAAWRIRGRYGPGLAIVSQDVIRRVILRVKDEPVNPAIALIDLTARYALDHGYHTVVEGNMTSASYGGMLAELVRDHAGRSACFYYDLTLDETVRRHSSKPQAAEYGAGFMQQWYRERDLIPALHETIIGPDVSLEAAVSMMMDAVALSTS